MKKNDFEVVKRAFTAAEQSVRKARYVADGMYMSLALLEKQEEQLSAGEGIPSLARDVRPVESLLLAAGIVFDYVSATEKALKDIRSIAEEAEC